MQKSEAAAGFTSRAFAGRGAIVYSPTIELCHLVVAGFLIFLRVSKFLCGVIMLDCEINIR
jgi:hypothetical protein